MTVVGAKEIAEEIGKSRDLVNSWRRPDRPQKVPFPEPRGKVSGNPAWDWEEDIVPWLRATDRGHLIKKPS